MPVSVDELGCFGRIVEMRFGFEVGSRLFVLRGVHTDGVLVFVGVYFLGDLLAANVE